MTSMDIKIRFLPVLIAVFIIFAVGTIKSTPFIVRAATEQQNIQEPPQETDESRSVWEGAYTEEQSKRGQAVYMEACSTCHLETLTGKLEDDVPTLVGDEFMTAWNGTTAGDLFERIRISMPQDNPGLLSRQENADVLAFIFNANKFPAGEKTLDSDLGALRLIRIEKKKATP